MFIQYLDMSSGLFAGTHPYSAALDILSDLVLNPTFDPKDITRKKA